MQTLLEILERENEIVISWFKESQAIIISRRKKTNVLYNLNKNNQIIKSTGFIIVLWFEIDKKLNFDVHISKICKKAR